MAKSVKHLLKARSGIQPIHFLPTKPIIGPYWFQDADGRPAALNTHQYIEQMRGKLILAKIFSSPNPFGLSSVGIPELQGLC